MPLTPLHHPLAYFIYKLDKRLSLPGLIVGCMIPDLEIPFIVLFLGTDIPNRMILHSILGSITFGTFFGVIIAVRAYPYIVNRIFHVDKKKVENKSKFSFIVIFSVLAGNLSHVFLDLTNHPYNPIFWPFYSTMATKNPLYFALGEPLGSMWIQIIMGFLLFALMIVNRKNLFEQLLVG